MIIDICIVKATRSQKPAPNHCAVCDERAARRPRWPRRRWRRRPARARRRQETSARTSPRGGGRALASVEDTGFSCVWLRSLCICGTLRQPSLLRNTYRAVLVVVGRAAIYWSDSLTVAQARDLHYGKSRIHRPRRHGRPDGRSPARQGPHGHRLQPHQVQGAVADRQRDEVGATRHAASRKAPTSIFVMVTDSAALEGVATVRTASSPASAPARPHRHEHGEPGGSRATRREGARARRRHGGLAGLGQHHHARAGQADDDGGRARVETFEQVKPLLLDIGPKATHVGDNGLARVDEDRDQPEPSRCRCSRSPKASCWPRRPASRARPRSRSTPTACIASPMVQYRGPFVLQHAGGGLVRHEDDAEGHDAGARDGPPARRAAADDGSGQRDSSRPRAAWGSRRRISPPCSTCSPSCQESRHDAPLRPASRRFEDPHRQAAPALQARWWRSACSRSASTISTRAR